MKVEWIKAEDKLPEGLEGEEGEYYVYAHGTVRGDVKWTEWGIEWDTCSVPPKTFYAPNSDPEYGVVFEIEVTHWAHKILPEPPDRPVPPGSAQTTL